MSQYAAIFTNAGRQLLADAVGAQSTFSIARFAVGSGPASAAVNNEPAPISATQTALAAEVYRATVNRVFRDPQLPQHIVVECIVPASVGGFVAREFGLFDTNGTLVAVANMPAMYKPSSEDGAFADTQIRCTFEVSNAAEAAAVQLVVDPNVVVATQQWVINNVLPGNLLPGGTTGQILAKRSNSSGDVEWRNAGTFEAVLSVLEEVQTLVAGQTTVTLATLTTDQAAVYVNGLRLRPDQWTPNPTNAAVFTLAVAATGGEKMVVVQNDPASAANPPLRRAANLADVADVPTARRNLDVPSNADLSAWLPAGVVVDFAGGEAPAGWLLANGDVVSRVTYARLFAAIGTRYGAGDGATTFRLPDLRGVVTRGLDLGRGLDPARVHNGQVQSDSIARHQHVFGSDDMVATCGSFEAAQGGFAYDANSRASGNGQRLRTQDDPAYPMAAETRMKNVAQLKIIKT